MFAFVHAYHWSIVGQTGSREQGRGCPRSGRGSQAAGNIPVKPLRN
jgi:hypothetical protein